MKTRREDLRNIAIIAHVDHGKTTLVDQLLRQAGIFRQNEQVQERALDSNDLERERGITILAKTTAIHYQDLTINIVDTPGHSDFGGEVERIMKMVDGVLLVVDAFEGCMPQTRFVLKKALEQKATPILVVNKMDRENARPPEVVDEVYDLFIDLGATEEQLEFPILYASGLKGTASTDPDTPGTDMKPLFEAIKEHIPAPLVDVEGPLQMQVTMLDYNDYLGRIGIGRIERGKIRAGDKVVQMKRDGTIRQVRIAKLFGFYGLKRIEIEEAKAGEIVAVPGLEEIMVGETVADAENPEALPLLTIDEPTIKMTFLVNDSPFAGREGKYLTSRKLAERLQQALETDVSLRVEGTGSPDAFIVSGRGELHLSILIETMRREGYELQVSKPEVILREVDGAKCEPFESLIVDIPDEFQGTVMESIAERKGELVNMENNGFGYVRLEYHIPSRGLIGYRKQFLTETRGYGVLNHSYLEYRPILPGNVGRRPAGVLVSMETGTATTYGLLSVEDRGVMFVRPGDEVYEGMIVGEHNRGNDIVVNVCKTKQLTNMRASTKEETTKLKAPRDFSLEEALEYINDDEYVEVTPKAIRLRKRFLKKIDRDKYERKRENLNV